MLTSILTLILALTVELSPRPDLSKVPNGKFKDAAADILQRSPQDDAKLLYEKGFRVLIADEDLMGPIGLNPESTVYEVFSPLSYKADKDAFMKDLAEQLSYRDRSKEELPSSGTADKKAFFDSLMWYGSTFNKTTLELHETSLEKKTSHSNGG